MTWTAIVVVGLGTYAMRAAGPVVLGGRTFPPHAQRALTLLAVALLAALIAIATVGKGQELHVDARLAGVGVALVAVALRMPFVVVIAVAALTAALLRLA